MLRADGGVLLELILLLCTRQQKSSSAFYPYGAGANLLDWSHSLIPDCIIFRTVCTFSWQPHPLTVIECFQTWFSLLCKSETGFIRCCLMILHLFEICGSLWFVICCLEHFARKTIPGASVERGSKLQ